MNKVYCFYDEHDSEGRTVYIADKNYKSARAVAMENRDGTFDFSDNLFIDIRGYMCRENREPKAQPITTDKVGQLDTSDLAELKLLRFYCADCDSNELEIIEDKYRCKKCGHIGAIPYV